MRDHSKEDRRHHDALERRSIGEARVDVVGNLNKMAAGNKELPGVGAYLLAQAMQTRGRDLARRNAKHDRAMAAGRLNDGEGERLDRSHPRTIAAQELRRRYW